MFFFIIFGYEVVVFIIVNGKCIGVKLKNRVFNEIYYVLVDKCVFVLGIIENLCLVI